MSTTQSTTKSEEILQNNLEHTLFSWSKQSGLNPINAHRADGVYLYDREGKKYIDFSSQLMNVNIGHGRQEITEAVKKQMEELSYVFPGMVTKARGDLGKKLSELAPGDLNKAFFTLGGAEAIENAIKLARIYTGRHKVVSLYRSYHGATYGAISAGGDPRKHPADSQAVPNMIHVENPYYHRCPWYSSSIEECGERAARQMEQVIEYEGPQNVAAILLEGESGSSGCIKYPPNYWPKIREIADKYGILLIDDEVMSGFGRTGKWFAVENFGVTPDIICMAKGLTSGYLPLGGIMVSDKVSSYFNDKPMLLGLTYSAHAVSCAAALENIRILEEENLMQNAVEKEGYILDKLSSMKKDHPSIGDYRMTGLLGCVELVKNRDTKEPVTPWNAPADKMEPTTRMAAKIRELGMFTFVRWNWIFIAPPLCITEEEIDKGLGIIEEAVKIADEYYEK
ncbi:MAG: aminotransferase class III-fold pyridoxal phosphate-dependent enzyme [Flavobacteriales bacterium]